jgi:hypothetical protein
MYVCNTYYVMHIIQYTKLCITLKRSNKKNCENCYNLKKSVIFFCVKLDHFSFSTKSSTKFKDLCIGFGTFSLDKTKFLTISIAEHAWSNVGIATVTSSLSSCSSSSESEIHIFLFC